ncbi:iron(III) transport system substrate-binding protein [Sphaerotilus hippei]|uniref:Iron(III) transport system substrate-binding protein n=1 Tax=Sphaerotilus hippei TaxID=744406 RepID=A0A318HG58_9BURK|nr:extracellular solute-binding protein [Sphaerotilus hippei]PXW98829.1 iron(III) transport system substrate-binding protein [Sphaerotilus hippei]
MNRRSSLPSLLALSAALVVAWPAQAQEQVLNIYSARHYQTDESLYANFTKATGIKINRLDGKEDELLERIRNEGANSPADILITVDAARLEMADSRGVFQPIQSKLLEARIPDTLRTPTWIAFSTRARAIVYNKLSMKKEWVQTYEDLANPRLKGQICVRSGNHPYNLSLGAAVIHHLGEAKAEEWARGLVANFARSPKGGDVDQLKAVAAGECSVAISNSYYIARMMRSSNADDQAVMRSLGVVWPNQQTWGTHINVSGAGVLKHAPHKAAAVKFMEYLAGDEAQTYFADGNNEWPAAKGVKPKNPALDALGPFKSDSLPIGELSKGAVTAQKVFDRAGWK